MIIWILLLIAAVILLYKYGTRNFDYFQKKGLAFNKPHFLVGSRLSTVLGTKNMIEMLTEIYNEHRDEKISGMFEFNRPAYFIRDPEMIKRLCIKEFDSFSDHRLILSKEAEPLFASALFGLTGQKWRDMRATLSPAFTGSKMRLMFKLINDVGSQMSNTVLEQINKGADNKIEFKEFAQKFTIDIIASCAFGLEINSFNNPNNDFLRIARKATNFATFKTTIKLVGLLGAPWLMKIFKIKFLDEEFYKFFGAMMTDTIKTREEKKITRNDMIDLILQAKHGKQLDYDNEEHTVDGFATVEESQLGKEKVKRTWEDDELLAQCVGFFFGGFETVSSVMTFMAAELIIDPNIQKKLQDEIDEVHKSLNGETLTYEHVQKMKYMDMVVCETLRKWPPAPIVDRKCTKEFNFEYDDKKFIMEYDKNFYVPIYSLHHDERYFPEPEKFDPERFNDENKKNIRQDCYIPFGIGPRNCIGNRFALLEVKTIFYYLLLNFTFEATNETEIPLKLGRSQTTLQLENGLKCALIPRAEE
ncbi:hypothetical protein PVAND_013109 [Polypedilum vanderplanki]|uniref:Cytochrome P450 n=1 Tax=Polypedilum vanderplanki TaxID=319348 RepID=A0A9J6CQG0_POLVA|nr:hypothetical protein PVAND_013109 [Polypedilum vanderplanki]